MQHRVKAKVLELLQLGSFKSIVHISGKYSPVKNCLAIVFPVCKHPTNTNGIIVYDLSIDPEPMLSLSIEDIQQRLFTATDDLPEGVTRIPLKTVHINKCPVLAPVSVIKPDDAQRLAIDLALCQVNIDKIKAAKGLAEKLAAVFSDHTHSEQEFDPDMAIYSGGFFSEADKQKMAKIRSMSPEQLARPAFSFIDPRLPEMLFRYRARNYPETLSADEQLRWNEFCLNRLEGRQAGAGITLDGYFARLRELRNIESDNMDIIKALDAYAVKLCNVWEVKTASIG
jgi:exodeoxyribonuclease-1